MTNFSKYFIFIEIIIIRLDDNLTNGKHN